MTAPGGVELNQNILLGVHGDLLEVRRHQNLDGVLVPVVRQRLREEVRLQKNGSLDSIRTLNSAPQVKALPSA